MLSFLCGFTRLFTGVQSHWVGVQPERKQRIYFSNHTSHFDCMVLLSVLPSGVRKSVRPCAAADYWSKTAVRRWISGRILRVLLVEREKITRANNPLHKIFESLDEGDSLIIFPEGGRSDGSHVGPFRSGLYHIGKGRPDVELVPVYIDNANRILPKGEIVPLPFICSITFGEPIAVRPGEAKDEFLRRAESAVQGCALR